MSILNDRRGATVEGLNVGAILLGYLGLLVLVVAILVARAPSAS
jgi:hypothetical protein